MYIFFALIFYIFSSSACTKILEFPLLFNAYQLFFLPTNILNL